MKKTFRGEISSSDFSKDEAGLQLEILWPVSMCNIYIMHHLFGKFTYNVPHIGVYTDVNIPSEHKQRAEAPILF